MDFNRLAEVLDEVVKRLDQTQNVMERLDTLQNHIEEVNDKLERLDQKTDLIKTQIVEIIAGHLNTVKKSMAAVVKKIDSVKTSLKNGRKTVKEDLEKSMATVVQKIDSVVTSVNNGRITVEDDLLSLNQRQDQVTKKIEQSTNEVKDTIYRSKHEIFAVTEKEAQIVRDRIEGPLPSLGKYSFDFYVENFHSLVRSGKDVHSPPWHVNEAKTSMAGCVWFEADGNIKVWFFHGRHPRKVGLQARPALILKVKAKICDVRNKVLPNIFLGGVTVDASETTIPDNGDWGWSLGEKSCDDLINKGYGQNEKYERGAILVRYDVTVL